MRGLSPPKKPGLYAPLGLSPSQMERRSLPKFASIDAEVRMA
jgi:hypothetical protein